MSQDLEKRVADLEKRVAKLEALLANPGALSKAKSDKESDKDQIEVYLKSYVRDADGSITKFWKSAKKVNYDTKSDGIYATIFLTNHGEVYNEKELACFYYESEKNLAFGAYKEMADEKGYTFSFAIDDNLPEDDEEAFSLLLKMNDELVRKFGKGGKALFEDYIIYEGKNYVYSRKNDKLFSVVQFISDAKIINREWVNEPFVDNPAWTPEERFNAVKTYVYSLKPKYND